MNQPIQLQPSLPGIPDAHLRISNTRLHSLWTCQQYYVWTYVHNLTGRSRPAYYDVGALFHEGSRNYLHPLNAMRPHPDRMKLGADAILTMAKLEEADEDSTLMALKLYKAYTEWLHQGDFLRDHRILSVEQWVEVPLTLDTPGPGPMVSIIAKCDGLLQKLSTEQLWVLELKTAASLRTPLERIFIEGPQTTQYLTVISDYLGQSIFGSYIHVTTKTAPYRTTQLEALHHQARSSIWLNAVKAHAELMLQLHNSQEPLRNLSACNTFNSECIFKPLCQWGLNATTKGLYAPRKDHLPHSDTRLGGGPATT